MPKDFGCHEDIDNRGHAVMLWYSSTTGIRHLMRLYNIPKIDLQLSNIVNRNELTLER